MDELTLMDWRRRTFAIYREVREASSPEAGHAIWRAQRDELFRDHPSSPLAGDDPLLMLTGARSTDALLDLPYDIVIERESGRAAQAELVR